MSLAYMKRAHQKHLTFCPIRNLKAVPLDRQALESILPLDEGFKMEGYPEVFPENRQSWANPNNIQVGPAPTTFQVVLEP